MTYFLCVISDPLSLFVYLVQERNCYPSPLNYYKFPKSVCVSANEVICHGIPDMRPVAVSCNDCRERNVSFSFQTCPLLPLAALLVCPNCIRFPSTSFLLVWLGGPTSIWPALVLCWWEHVSVLLTFKALSSSPWTIARDKSRRVYEFRSCPARYRGIFRQRPFCWFWVHIETGRSGMPILCVLRSCILVDFWCRLLQFIGCIESLHHKASRCFDAPSYCKTWEYLRLQDGDIINLDVTVYVEYKGSCYHGDLNETFLVGNCDEESVKLVKCAYDCRELPYLYLCMDVVWKIVKKKACSVKLVKSTYDCRGLSCLLLGVCGANV